MMTRLQKLLAIAALALIPSLGFYLFEIRNSAYVFWALCLAISIVIAIQIHLSSHRTTNRLIYLELVFLFVILQMLSISHAGTKSLYWLDSYYDFRATENIMEGRWDPMSDQLGSVGGYPAVHFLAASESYVAGIGLVSIARWIGLLLHTLAFSFLILSARKVFEKENVVQLSSLSLAFLYYFVMVSGYGRMPLSTCLFFFVLYLVVRNLRKSLAPNQIAVIVCIGTLLIAHPLALLLLAIFIVVLTCVAKIHHADRSFFQETRHASLSSGRRTVGVIQLLMLIVVLSTAYFAYVSLWEQKVLVSTLMIIKGVKGGQAIGTAMGLPLHWQLFLYGQAILGAFLVLVTLGSYSSRRDMRNVSYAAFAIVLTGISFFFYYFGIEFLRFTLFSWPALLLASLNGLDRGRYRKLALLVVLVFILVNVVGYYPSTYDRGIQRPVGEWRQYLTEQEISAVASLKAEGSIVGNYYFHMAYVYVLGEETEIDVRFYSEGYRTSTDFDYFFLESEDRNWIFLRNETSYATDYPRVTEQDYVSYQESHLMNRIYDNGDVEVYGIR